MKRTAVLFLALMAVGAQAQQGAPSDVPRNHWAYEAVDTLFRQGLLKGYPDGTFKGSRPASRFEMAGLLANLNAHFEQRLTALRPVSGQAAPDLTEFQSQLSILRRDVASLQASHREVGELTGRMASLRDQLGSVRRDLDEMRRNLNRK